MHMVFLVCMSTFSVATPTFSQPINTDDNYGIILDGGSSGTKLKVYRWSYRSVSVTVSTADGSSDVIKTDISLIANMKFKPGISDLVDSLHDYLDDILEAASEAVPLRHQSRTPIYFLATAGLRSKPIEVTDELLSSIETYLRQYGVFHNPYNNVRVISGEEEAVYAWVAANYLRGFFYGDTPTNEAVGVLEMGGGSTQIAFLPDHSIYANMFPVYLGGVTYQLYAHSYLFYGQNYIISRINDFLLALRTGNDVIIDNPCMLKGDNTTVSLFQESVHIQGTANVTKCLEIIEIFLRTADDDWCYPKPCAIGRTYQPPVKNLVFYAISAFSYAPTYLEAVDEQGLLDLTLLKTNAVEYCDKSLEEVVSSGLSAAYASPYCIMGLYIPSLLLDAYNFNEDKNKVYVKTSIDGVNIDWALGAMLLLSESQDGGCDISAATQLPDMRKTCLSILLPAVVYIINVFLIQ
ncbi:hypothetical protein ACF0H5_002810 [Mactra antiquata]